MQKIERQEKNIKMKNNTEKIKSLRKTRNKKASK